MAPLREPNPYSTKIFNVLISNSTHSTVLQIQKNLSRSFYAIISLPSTAMGFALSVQISALSWILTTKYNLDIHEVGIVWAAGPLAGIFGQVIIGLISDNVWFWGGRRRPFILIGGVLAASMLLALPNIDSIRSFFGIESLLGVAVFVALTLDLAINISFNPTRSVIADVTPEGNPRTKGYTWMQTISGFFGVLAYVIGAVFGNYVLIYFGVFIVLFFSILPVFFISERRTLSETEMSESVDKGRKVESTTKWGQLIRLYVAHAFSWIGVQTMFVYIIAYIQQKLAADSNGSALFSGQVISISFAVLNTIGFILPGLVLEPIAEKMGRVKTHLSSVAIMAIGYFLIAFFGKDSVRFICPHWNCRRRAGPPLSACLLPSCSECSEKPHGIFHGHLHFLRSSAFREPRTRHSHPACGRQRAPSFSISGAQCCFSAFFFDK